MRKAVCNYMGKKEIKSKHFLLCIRGGYIFGSKDSAGGVDQEALSVSVFRGFFWGWGLIFLNNY
jgi:hypothetical protein